MMYSRACLPLLTPPIPDTGMSTVCRIVATEASPRGRIFESARAVALRDAIDAASHEVYADLNQEIHLAIWTAADNRRLKRMLLELWNGPSVGPGPEAAREHYRASAREHVEILSAIAAGDAAAARAAMDGHIRRSMENMLAAWPD